MTITPIDVPNGDEPARPERIKFVCEKIQESVRDYVNGRQNSRHYAFGLKFSSTLLATITAVLLGVKSISVVSLYEPWFSLGALITSAFATIATFWESFFESRWMWIFYSKFAARFQNIMDNFRYETSGNPGISEKRLAEIYNDLQGTLREANAEWVERRGAETRLAGAGAKP
jgi:hypothetical protein